MARSTTQYRVFIATPGGLDGERKAFRETLELYTASDAEPRGVTFHPVGWEETLGGVGRAQDLINKDLEQCDYAVFVWHDRWGSRTGKRKMVGTEEEWKLAEELYATLQVRNIAVFFKNVDERQLRDPGEQLKRVLAHKKSIEKEKRYFFKSYDQLDTFCGELRKHLAQWLRDHEKGAGGAATAGGDESTAATEGPGAARFARAVGSVLATSAASAISSSTPSLAVSEARTPNFRFWIEEINRLLEADTADPATYSDALFCARKALASGASNLEWAEATNAMGICQLHLNKPANAIAYFSGIVTRFEGAADPDRRYWLARAAFNNGATFFQLGRSEDAVAVFDDVIARFGAASELALREGVARALVNKGLGLGELGRSEDAIAVYDDVIARFGAAGELALLEPVAWALVNKGVALVELGRSEDAIAVYDDVIARFGADDNLMLKTIVENAKKRCLLAAKAQGSRTESQ